MKRRQVLTYTAGLVGGSLLGLSTTNTRASDAPFIAGEHYQVLPEPLRVTGDDSTVEVAEVFSYMCIHCANYQGPVEQWRTPSNQRLIAA